MSMAIRDEERWRVSGQSLQHREDLRDGKRMTVTPEAWTVIGTGIVILGAIAASNRQVRLEINKIHSEIGQLRERMAKLEGLLEGLREAITGRRTE